MLAPFVKFEHVIKQIAEALDLEPEEVCNDPSTAAIYAQIIGMAGGLGGSGSPEGMDASGVGGANIGTGSVPSPGTSGFTGNNNSSGPAVNSAKAESASAT